MAGAERNSILGTYEFSPYAAGSKTYGQAMSSPTMGPVDKTGYRNRDRRLKAKRNAVLAKMKAGNAGAFASPDYLRFSR
jgi:hypothetical protein